MTLDEAVGHVGQPVLIRTAPGRVRDAEIASVDETRQRVQVRVRRTGSHDFLPTPQWWHPTHLSIPQWWYDRQKENR